MRFVYLVVGVANVSEVDYRLCSHEEVLVEPLDLRGCPFLVFEPLSFFEIIKGLIKDLFLESSELII